VNWKIKTLAFVMATSLFFHVDSQTDKTAWNMVPANAWSWIRDTSQSSVVNSKVPKLCETLTHPPKTVWKLSLKQHSSMRDESKLLARQLNDFRKDINANYTSHRTRNGAENTAVGIRHADHVASSIHKRWH
jgi:hypothetical protein